MSEEFHIVCWLALFFGTGGFMSSMVALVKLNGKADRREPTERRRDDP